VNRPFIKGLKLCELFYEEAVEPILTERFPDLVYSAALIGPGSEVLGFDTPQSMDHDWGPGLTLFLSDADHQAHREGIDQVLRHELAREIHGYPTNLAIVGGDSVEAHCTGRGVHGAVRSGWR
jgi:hypothetical protein